MHSVTEFRILSVNDAGGVMLSELICWLLALSPCGLVVGCAPSLDIQYSVLYGVCTETSGLSWGYK